LIGAGGEKGAAAQCASPFLLWAEKADWGIR
jgi:hypothetical protein